MKTFGVFLFLLWTIFVCTEGKYVKDSISTNKRFNYLTRFCFEEGIGSMTFQATTNQASKLQLAIYFDGNGEWEQVWPSSCDTVECCEDSLKRAKEVTAFASGEVKKFAFSEGVRAHYWYFALANCQGENIAMDYEITLLQPESGWNQQLSCDEKGMQVMYILFTVLFTVGVVVHLYGDFQLFRARSLHPVIRLLTISIVLQLFSLFFYMLYYCVYASSGVTNLGLSIMAQIFDWFSTLIFMLLLILIAKGWGITYPTLSHFQDQKKVLLLILGTFLLSYIVLFFWGLFGLDQSRAVYLYSSPPGIVYLVLRFLTMIYFMWCLHHTLRDDTDHSKRVFYIIFGLGYTLWFLALPIIVLVSLALAQFVRAKIVYAIYVVTVTLGFSIIGFLLWPSRASKFFQVAVPDLLGSGYERL